MNKIKIMNHLFSFMIIANATNCGVFVGNPKDNTDGKKISAVPENSAGEIVPVSLTFTAKVVSQNLVANQLSIDQAFIHFSKLRLDPTFEESEEEKQLAEEIKAQKEQMEKDLENQVKEVEEKIEGVKKTYDEELEDIEDEEEKKSLEEQEKREIADLESDIATIKSDSENEIDAYELSVDDTIRVSTRHFYDLVAQTITPNIDSFDSYDGSFYRIELEFVPVLEVGDLPADSTNRSLYITGTASFGSLSRNFTIESNERIKLEIKNEQGIYLDPDKQNQINLEIDLVPILQDINFVGAELDSRGNIVINQDVNKDIYESFLNSLNDSFRQR